MRATQYTVSGQGPFPFHLIDIDGAWARDSIDRSKINDRRSRRAVTLCTTLPMAPDFDVWARAGWPVVDIIR